MKHCIVEDSSFIVATIDSNDPFHASALFIFRQLLQKRGKIKIIIPPLGLYEVVVTLTRKGVDHSRIEAVVMKLLHIEDVIVSSISEASALKHCRNTLTSNNQTMALRTGDFFITNLGMDFDAQILTFDKKMWTKIKPVYSKIYYCSSIGRMTDETKDFIQELNIAAP